MKLVSVSLSTLDEPLRQVKIYFWLFFEGNVPPLLLLKPSYVVKQKIFRQRRLKRFHISNLQIILEIQKRITLYTGLPILTITYAFSSVIFLSIPWHLKTKYTRAFRASAWVLGYRLILKGSNMGSWSMIFSVFVQTAALPQTVVHYFWQLCLLRKINRNLKKEKAKKNVTTVGWFSETGK